MGQAGRDGSASLGKQGGIQLTVRAFIAFMIPDLLFFNLVSLSASTPSEDLASGDPMGMNKTGTLGPADKDRRSKKKLVDYVP